MSGESEYNAIPAVRWSRLKAMRTSPLAYRWNEQNGEDDDTVALRIGRAVHCMLLEPAKYLTEFAVWPKTRRGREWEAFRDAHPNHDIITGSEAEVAEACVRALEAHPLAMSILTNAERKEHTITWTDQRTGLRCKSRVDLLNGRLSDLKSATSVIPRVFAAQVHRLGYHGQLGFYEMGLEANGFELHDVPALIAVQNNAPFDVVVYRVPRETMDRGHALARTLLDRLAECIEANEWPGLAPDEELELHLPAWPDMDDEEQEPTVTFGGVPLEV